MPSRDKDVIGLTTEAQRQIEDIEAHGWFKDRVDIARFCLAFAVRSGCKPGLSDQVDTRWAAGNFDKAGEIRAVLRAMYPNVEHPVRLMEFLVNTGIEMVHRRVEEGAGPSELLG